jgi:hypothetical protein
MFPPFTPSSEEQIRKAIDALRRLDLSTVSIEEIKEYVKILLTGHQLSAPIFNPPVRLHRARKMKTLPSLLKEIGAPPPDKVLYDQRCNRAGESLFYCSSARNAPFFEVHAEVGDQLVLSEWCTTVKMTVNHIGYTHSNFTRLQSTRECPNWANSTPSFQPTDKMRLVDEFFSSYFSIDVRDGQEHPYRATIAMTEKLIAAPTVPGAFRFDGLMYPTIPMNGNCENFALKREFVERGVEFVKAEYVKIRVIDGMKMNMDTLDFANSLRPDGGLEWKGRPGRWVVKPGQQVKVSVDEQGEYICHDTSGNLVPME